VERRAWPEERARTRWERADRKKKDRLKFWLFIDRYRFMIMQMYISIYRSNFR
jgi:hypothetical protein